MKKKGEAIPHTEYECVPVAEKDYEKMSSKVLAMAMAMVVAMMVPGTSGWI